LNFLLVSEIFSSIQGEGEVIGIPSNFIRLAGCNLRCIYCDTKYSWNHGVKISVDQIIKQVDDSIKLVTITGGEPLLQDIHPLVTRLKQLGHIICVETNGTIAPNESLLQLVDYWSVSPKLSNALVKYKLRFPVEKVRDNIWYKFVVCNLTDIEEIKKFVRACRIPPDKVILQPNGLLSDEKYFDLAKLVFEYIITQKLPFRFIPQVHRIIWGRGVRKK